MIIDWNKYFDNIYILSRCSNFEKRQKLDNELNRINLYNYKYWYNCDNNLINYQKYENHIENISSIRCIFGHYTLIKTLYELNVKNVLILEDDIVFLKNIDKIYEQLEEFYKNKDQYNIYLFDYVKNGKDVFYNSSCYYLDRKGMEWIIYCIEKYPIMNDCCFYSNDLLEIYKNNFLIYTNHGDDIYIYLDENIIPKINLSQKRICIQNQYDLDHSSYIDYNNEIDFEKYNIT